MAASEVRAADGRKWTTYIVRIPKEDGQKREKVCVFPKIAANSFKGQLNWVSVAPDDTGSIGVVDVSPAIGPRIVWVILVNLSKDEGDGWWEFVEVAVEILHAAGWVVDGTGEGEVAFHLVGRWWPPFW